MIMQEFWRSGWGLLVIWLLIIGIVGGAFAIGESLGWHYVGLAVLIMFFTAIPALIIWFEISNDRGDASRRHPSVTPKPPHRRVQE